MTATTWTSVVVAVIAGLVAGIIAPLMTAWLSRRNWRHQKHQELKYDVFKGAVAALATWEADALDAALQNSKPTYKDRARLVEMRPQTSQALTHYRSLLEAFFSEDVSLRFTAALCVYVAIDNVPNLEFEAARLGFVKAASAELGLREV